MRCPTRPREVSTLSFADLRIANVARCESAWHPVAEWRPTDWACALAGEAGELCNWIKKELRDGVSRKDEIAKELADVVTYADLLAARYGIDLGAAVRDKFNEVSQRVLSPIRLEG